MATLSIKRLPPCPGRTLVIGDIHGCLNELKTLVEAFAPTAEDRLIAVGDLINRGPDSTGVLALARDLGIHPILGNHELRLLRARAGNNPGTLKSRDRKTYQQLTEADWGWILTWPHVIQIPSLNCLIVHGGFAPGIPWRDQDPDVITSIQVIDGGGRPARRTDLPAGKPWAVSWSGPEHVIYGHTPRPHPLLHPLATGLDTGCVYGYTLTAVSLPGHEFYRAHARRAYID